MRSIFRRFKFIPMACPPQQFEKGLSWVTGTPNEFYFHSLLPVQKIHFSSKGKFEPYFSRLHFIWIMRPKIRYQNTVKGIKMRSFDLTIISDDLPAPLIRLMTSRGPRNTCTAMPWINFVRSKNRFLFFRDKKRFGFVFTNLYAK